MWKARKLSWQRPQYFMSGNRTSGNLSVTPRAILGANARCCEDFHALLASKRRWINITSRNNMRLTFKLKIWIGLLGLSTRIAFSSETKVAEATQERAVPTVTSVTPPGVIRFGIRDQTGSIMALSQAIQNDWRTGGGIAVSHNGQMVAFSVIAEPVVNPRHPTGVAEGMAGT